MRDLKYIVKRVLIGVGIILVLSFLRGNKVKALDNISTNTGTVSKTDVENSSINQLIWSQSLMSLYQDTATGDIILCNGSNTCAIYYVSSLNFPYTNIGVVYPSSPSSSRNLYKIFLTNDSQLPLFNSLSNTQWNEITFKSPTLYLGNYVGLFNDISSYKTMFLAYTNEVFNDGTHNYSSYTFRSNTEWAYMLYSGTYIYATNDLTIVSFGAVAPEIESLQPTKITNNNVITGYIFRPKFSNFNTDSYIYQYKVGKDSTRWLSLNSNEQQIRINNNFELYVRIKDISSNEIIDSQTYTITDIGTFGTQQDYNITFSGEYRTENYLNDNISSKSQSKIQEYQIYVDYTPKTSILKYQYQYVNEGDSLDNNNWQTLASSKNGTFTYLSTENGTLYARILDSSDNVLYSSTFIVNSIGLLAFDNSEDKYDDFFTSLRNKIDFGGPIGSLINIPITLLQTISDSFNGMTGVCSNYNLGSLFGHNLYLPCVDVKGYLGSSLYTTIDIIISCVMIYCILKMLSTAYYQFLLLESTPIPEDMSDSLNVSYRRW